VRRKTANKEDVSYELRNKLYDKYKLKLTPEIALLLVNEIVTILRVMLLSKYYDKINLEGLGFWKFRKRPARRLSGNLPQTK
jgi:nucleoid DNA-binding protein